MKYDPVKELMRYRIKDGWKNYARCRIEKMKREIEQLLKEYENDV